MATRKSVRMQRPGRRAPMVEDQGAQIARRTRRKSVQDEYPGMVRESSADLQGGAIDPAGSPSPPVRGETPDGMAPTNVRRFPAPANVSRSRNRDRDDHHVLKVVRESRDEADEARRRRMELNARNMDAFMDLQDWSEKTEGQSTEFLPKISTSAEQFSAFVKRALVQFGDWFSVNLMEGVQPVLTDTQIKKICQFFFASMPDGINKTSTLERIIGDGAKMGLLESLIIFKVYGKPHMLPGYSVEPGTPIIDMQTRKQRPGEPTLRQNSKPTWRLCVDLVEAQNYFPDPTGRGLYEIHRVERDLWQVEEMVEAGVYDREAFENMATDNPLPQEDKRLEQHRGGNQFGNPSFRKRCYIDEYWGTILDMDGKILHRNCLATVGNDKHVLRRPMDNPYWHGQSCFVAQPLIRVPHSVWHKAVYDSASSLNLAINEMFNLMLDGGIASVWGISQLRGAYLSDPRQVSGGIPQGITLAVNEALPANTKVYERVAEGSVPQDAMAVFEMLMREFTQSALTNEIKLGSLPPRQVLASEIQQADQSQAVTLDSIAADLEREGIGRVIMLSWLTILQHLKEVDVDELSGILGRGVAEILVSFSEAEIFAALAPTANFKVFGLSATLSRVRDFQKTMGLMQAVGANPMLMQAFWAKYSPDKIINQAMKQLNMNPDDILMTPEELEAMPQRLAQLMMFAQITGGMKGQQAQDGTGGMEAAGGAQMQEIRSTQGQQANPMTGMKP